MQPSFQPLCMSITGHLNLRLLALADGVQSVVPSVYHGGGSPGLVKISAVASPYEIGEGVMQLSIVQCLSMRSSGAAKPQSCPPTAHYATLPHVLHGHEQDK